MFIEQKKQPEQTNQGFPSAQNQNNDGKSFLSKWGVIFIVLAVILGLVVFLYFKFFNKPFIPPAQQIDNPEDNNLSSTSTLPTFPGDNSGENGGLNENNGLDIKAENITFGYFYKKEDDDFTPKQANFDLPINIKTDVANYYEISRKLNLDPHITELNQNGFVVMDNPFVDTANDFFSIYNTLSQKDIPLLLTNDLIIYYYQNNLKELFKEIEKDIFYENIWQINRDFYKIANIRYMARNNEVGMVNDPILEGARREVAFFAVALELLKPKIDQIINDYKSDLLFTKDESIGLGFNIPDYLKDDVAKEIKLINQASEIVKSPVLLYRKDYRDFRIPPEYAKDAKLKNYFLASKWMNSTFPLYYKDNDCQDCLLDENDWLINMLAASLIAKDFSENQEFKNQWAKIYKVISFFSGLRHDLTYLHYHKSLTGLFGENYDIYEIFTDDNPGRENDLLKLQQAIAKYEFPPIEGSFDRTAASNKPWLGMKILQDNYWPNNYLFSELTYPKVNKYLGELKDSSGTLTYCHKDIFIQRCQGISLDIINLVHPIPESNSYFKNNIYFNNYDQQADILKKQLNNFNTNSWYNNNYWTTLSLIKQFLGSDSQARPIYINNESWQEKNLNTALGSWVNLQLPVEGITKIVKPDEISGPGTVIRTNDYDYIEPDLVLVNELIASTKMISQTLAALGVVSDYEFSKLNQLAEKLEEIKLIIKKELNDENLDFNDLQVINSLARQLAVSSKGAKSFDLIYPGFSRAINESIEGFKILVFTYERGGKKIFTFGPIFNYQEK